MTCRIERPDPQVLFQRHLDLFSNTVLGGAQVIPESNEWYATSVNYALTEQFYAIADQAFQSLNPRLACCEDLYAMAARDGVFPFAASFAQGFVELTGVPGTLLPSPLDFSIGDTTFVTANTATQPSQIGPGGTAIVRVRALVPGLAGNLQVATGQLVTQVVDVESEVRLCGGTMCEGHEAEECETFRARYLRRLQFRPRATNAFVLEKLLEWPCATRALQRAGECCQCGCGDRSQPLPEDCDDCGCKDCGGDLAFYVMFDNAFPCGIAPPSIIEEIQDWLFGSPQGYGLGQMEVGVCGNVVPVNPLQVDVFVDVNDCLTTTQVTQIDAQIREFFTTVEPSKPLRAQQLEIIVGNIVGGNVNYNVRVQPSTAEDALNMYQGNCDIEPNCDYIPCLNFLGINRNTNPDQDCQ